MEATITLEYPNLRLAKAVANAVSPDNFKTPPNMTVTTAVHRKQVVSVIKCEGKIATFTATVDDLLFSVNTAEKSLKALET